VTGVGFRRVVIDLFRHPKNRGPLPDASASAEGANPLCGDRIRVELRGDSRRVTEARFTADACALCIASASLLTERVRGMTAEDALGIDTGWLFASLEGDPPPGRRKCAILPLDTLRRAIAALPSA
jgi:nitrogen fixation protein NifU and related proteins